MALITRTYLVDDIDGSEDEVSTVRFNLDRTDYEIDLTAVNAELLRGKLAKFVDAASAVKPASTRPAKHGTKAAKRSPKTADTRPNREQTQAVREWARSNGFEVSNRGRISKSIQEAFDAAH